MDISVGNPYKDVSIKLQGFWSHKILTLLIDRFVNFFKQILFKKSIY